MLARIGFTISWIKHIREFLGKQLPVIHPDGLVRFCKLNGPPLHSNIPEKGTCILDFDMIGVEPAGLKSALHGNRHKEDEEGLNVSLAGFRLLDLDIKLVRLGTCDFGILQRHDVN